VKDIGSARVRVNVTDGARAAAAAAGGAGSVSLVTALS